MRTVVWVLSTVVVAGVYGLASLTPPQAETPPPPAVVQVPFSGEEVTRETGLTRGEKALARLWAMRSYERVMTMSGSAKTSSSVSSPGCDGQPKDLFVSGIVSGQMTEMSPGRNWHLNDTLYMGNNTYCITEINVDCIDGVLTASGTLAGCVTVVIGDVEVISSDPVLISITFADLPPGCLCPEGVVTVSE